MSSAVRERAAAQIASIAVAFPTGMGGKGNEGIAGFTARTKGAIGYVEHAYAIRSKPCIEKQRRRLRYAKQTGVSVCRRQRQFAHASCAALEQPGKQTRPITGATFALISEQQQRRLTAIEMLRLFDWTYRAGAKLADELQYGPMPKDVVEMIESAWVEVMDASGQPAQQSADTYLPIAAPRRSARNVRNAGGSLARN